MSSPVIVFHHIQKTTHYYFKNDLGAINVLNKPICNANKFEKYIEEKLSNNTRIYIYIQKKY